MANPNSTKLKKENALGSVLRVPTTPEVLFFAKLRASA
jgi:hypothetical protein